MKLPQLAAFAVAAMTTSANATTTLTGAWQEFFTTASTYGAFATHSGGTPIVSDRTYRSEAIYTQTNAMGSSISIGRQNGTFSNGVFEFSGGASSELFGNSYPSGQVFVTQRFDIKIEDQREELTINLLSAQYTNKNYTYNPGFYYSATSGNQYSAYGLADLGANSLLLSPGIYQIAVGVQITQNSYQAMAMAAEFRNTITFSNLQIAPGTLQNDPIIPEVSFTFRDAPSGRWFDPPATSGFLFKGQNGTLFTEIMGLPTGFNAPFKIYAEGREIGLFGSNDSINFVELLGHGVSEFQLTDISPGVDAANPRAFPIQLAFDRPTGDFTMTPVPEPNTLLLLFSGVITVFFKQKMRWHKIKPNCRFNADANTGHAFGIFMASFGTLRASRSGAG